MQLLVPVPSVATRTQAKLLRQINKALQGKPDDLVTLYGEFNE